MLYRLLMIPMLAFSLIACGKTNPDDSKKDQEEPGTEESVMDKINSRKGTLLLVCGSNMVYLIDARPAVAQGYKSAILWQWNAVSAASTLHLDASRMNHLDDCKPVDDGKKLLITSSYNWAVLLDIETKKVLWYSKDSKNAHSADCLPGNRIAVACSAGTETEQGDKVQVFDAASGKLLYDTPFQSTHGVVWNASTQRLYVGGKSLLNIYKLQDWDTSTPSLVLDKSIKTSDYVTGVHDVTLVNDKTLLVAGKKAALYDISSGRFSALGSFANSTALKSVNRHPSTNEVWYTDATEPEGDYTWSSYLVRHRSDASVGSEDMSIRITDINIYKVRVYRWAK